jgi:hypothetical protein
MHKKTKHNYGADGEKKGRGRPRKIVYNINIAHLTQPARATR